LQGRNKFKLATLIRESRLPPNTIIQLTNYRDWEEVCSVELSDCGPKLWNSLPRPRQTKLVQVVNHLQGESAPKEGHGEYGTVPERQEKELRNCSVSFSQLELASLHIQIHRILGCCPWGEKVALNVSEWIGQLEGRCCCDFS
jgi:hypothetical protein